jgi:hypothetical protein
VPGTHTSDLAQRTSLALDEIAMMRRFVRDLPRFLRQPVEPVAARRIVRERLATREPRFLNVVERTIYRQPSSPYLRLLRHAGCELGDLCALVRREGIEGALTDLAGRGVYVTFDEFKGRREIVRGSLRFGPDNSDFDQPDTECHFVIQTSGTGGRPSRVRRNLLFDIETAIVTAISLDDHGLKRPRQAFWLGAPITWMLVAAKLRHPVVGWLTPMAPLPVKLRLGSLALRGLTAMAGQPLPLPRFQDLQDNRPVVEWIVREQREPDLVFLTTPSSATRIAASALEMGADLSGTTFLLQNEPVTNARQRQIVATGARMITRYGATETVTPSFGCGTPATPDDVHLMSDRYALTERTRLAMEDGPEVRALMLTGIHRAIPKVVFNTEIGDSATVERRACGCELGALGLETHISDIRSFEKLTGEGMTFARTNLQFILEEILPARLGGRPIDYQIVEEEDAGGEVRLVLAIDPNVPNVDSAAARAIFLEALERDGGVDKHMASLWRSAETLLVRREAPRATRAGKVLPLHLARGTSVRV